MKKLIFPSYFCFLLLCLNGLSQTDTLPDCDDLEPFQCTSDLYQFIDAQFTQITINPLSTNPIGPSYGSYFNNINAIGYNVQDNYIYGLAWGDGQSNTVHLIKIGSNGLMCDLGTMPSLPTDDAADMDLNGNLIFVKNDTMYAIDVSSSPINITSTYVGSYGGNDMSYNPNDGLFYAINNPGNLLYILDPVTGIVSTMNIAPAIPCLGSGFGAQHFDQNGNMYISCNNSGDIFEVDIITGNWQFTVNTGISTPKNDGASCPLAPPPFVEDCPDILEINAPIEICSSDILEISVLVDSMSIGGVNYGLDFITSPTPIAPYGGGTVVGSLTYNDLTNSSTNAIININPFSLPVGTNYVYAIVNPVPTDTECVPSANIIIEVLDGPATPPILTNTNTTFCKIINAIVTVLGDTGDSFAWYSDAALTVPANGATTGTSNENYYTSLTSAGGTETVYVTQVDANGCQSEALEIMITIDPCKANGGRF